MHVACVYDNEEILLRAGEQLWDHISRCLDPDCPSVAHHDYMMTNAVGRSVKKHDISVVNIAIISLFIGIGIGMCL